MVEKMRMGEKKAERRNEADEDGMESVDLSGYSLASLPNTSLNLATIGKLDVSNNNLVSIPESLTARMLNLIILDVHSNQLKSLPNSIGCLSKLKILNISGNLLESLPKTIENCRALEDLNANFNGLTKLPDTLGFELVNLKKLYVNSNKITHLPYSTSHMIALRVLDARLNCLRSLPEGLENLVNLEILNVSQNFQYLEILPYSVGLMVNLQELDVSYNRITALPDSISLLKKLRKLHVEGNPLVSPPLETVDQGLEAVKGYLSRKMSADGKKGGKKKSWLGKMGRFRTANEPVFTAVGDRHDGFAYSDYRSIDGLASPRYMGMFSPKRLFSPKKFSFFSPSR